MVEIIKMKNILVNQEPETWQDAIRNVGNILVNSGSTSVQYIDAMISAVDNLGPYIVIGKHLAIAHAAPGIYVNENDLSVSILSKPVNFGSENDPVSVLFALSSVDGKSHLNELVQLAQVLGEDDQIINRLGSCHTPEEVYRIINGDNNSMELLSHRKEN